MKKETIYKFLFFISGFLLLGFIIRLSADYFTYDTIKNSAPFYVLIIERSIEFVLPSIIAFVGAIILKKRFNKQ